MPSIGPRAFHHADFSARDLVEAKGGTTVSVCLPARDEADTIGAIVGSIQAELVDRYGVVDEIVVLDDHSTDATAAVASAAGARVVDVSAVMADQGDGHGKGEALWKSMFVTSGDVIAWCDADIRDFDPDFVVGLVGPLLVDPGIDFVKGFYERPEDNGGGRGGRVTELVARPLIAALFPELSGFVQPLAGEYAGRRTVMERLAYVEGYGVDLGLLIDVTRLVGVGRIAQSDLGVRRHRNRPIDELSPQALAVLLTALGRAGDGLVPPSAVLRRPDLDPVTVSAVERPPPIEVPAYRRRTA